jgi:hypothetical protein
MMALLLTKIKLIYKSLFILIELYFISINDKRNCKVVFFVKILVFLTY